MNVAQSCRYMAVLRLLTALRRAMSITEGFGQCHVTRELGVYQCREFSNRNTIILDDEGATTKPKQRPKTIPVPKITLISLDNTMTVTNLENAERLAKRRKLYLIKVSDPDNKTYRAVYKLTNSLAGNTEIFENNSSNNQKSKSPKLLYISATITNHDLLIKTKNIVKLLNKDNTVKIHITLDDNKEDNILDTITEMVKDVGNIQKLTSKKKMILLLITPLNQKNANKHKDNEEETVASSAVNISNNT